MLLRPPRGQQGAAGTDSFQCLHAAKPRKPHSDAGYLPALGLKSERRSGRTQKLTCGGNVMAGPEFLMPQQGFLFLGPDFPLPYHEG